MSDHHIALTGVLAQSGLIPDEQRELLLQLVQGPERAPVGRFPDAPNDYVAQLKDLLLSVFLPQLGPLRISQPQVPCEVILRSKNWNLVSRELFHNSLRPDWN